MVLVLDTLLILESQYRVSSGSLFGSLVVDKERMKPVGDFLWLQLMLCVNFSAFTLLLGWQ